MAIDPSIPISVRPPEFLSPAQTIQLSSLAMQYRQQQQAQRQQQAVMQLNQMPGMRTPQGIPTDQYIMALGKINPALQDEAVQERAKTLAAQSLAFEREQKANEAKAKAAEGKRREIIKGALGVYYNTPGTEENKQRAYKTYISEQANALKTSGQGLEYGWDEARLDHMAATYPSVPDAEAFVLGGEKEKPTAPQGFEEDPELPGRFIKTGGTKLADVGKEPSAKGYAVPKDFMPDPEHPGRIMPMPGGPKDPTSESKAAETALGKINDDERHGRITKSQADRLRKLAEKEDEWGPPVAANDKEGNPIFIQQKKGTTELRVLRTAQEPGKPTKVEILPKSAGAGARLDPEGLEVASWNKLLFGKEPSGMGNASAGQRAQVANMSAHIGKQLGLTPAEQVMLPQDNKVKMKAVDALTKWGAFVGKSSEQLDKSLDLALDYAKQLDPTRIKLVNQGILRGRTEFNDPIANAYALQLNTVRTEYARLMSGPTSNAMLPVDAARHADSLISNGVDVPSLEEMSKVIRRDSKITTNAVSNQRKQLMDSIQNLGKSAEPAAPSAGGWKIERIQ